MTPASQPRPDAATRRVLRAAVWLPGLGVAVGAAVATAHGLFEVAVAAGVPSGIAWLYPLITDGLALVAYTATARLSAGAARYAWSVVVLAAGLSGLAQAAYLAGGATLDASPALRFGVGAWPAVAAAVAAHLLHLLAVARAVQPGVQPGPSDHRAEPAAPAAAHLDQPPTDSTSEHRASRGVQPPVATARERAGVAAVDHAKRHGALPTVSELERLAAVSRGTAAAALKTLREQPTPLHLVPNHTDERT